MSNNIRNYHLGFSPLSENIFIYRGRDGKAESKAERTSEFIACLLDWCDPGHCRGFTDGDGRQYIVTVEEA